MDFGHRAQPAQLVDVEPRRGAVSLELQLDDVSAGQRRDQLGRRAEPHQLAVIHDGHAIAEALGLFHVVRGQHHGAAARAVGSDEAPHLAARLRVEPGGRLVEKEHLGLANQGAGDGQALALPARQLAHPGGPLFLQLDVGEQSRERPRPAVEAAKEREQLRHGQLLRQVGLLQSHPDALAQLALVAIPAQAEQLDLARRGFEQALDHLHGRGLARAVRSEQAETLAAPDGQIQAVDRDDGRRRLAEDTVLAVVDLAQAPAGDGGCAIFLVHWHAV